MSMSAVKAYHSLETNPSVLESIMDDRLTISTKCASVTADLSSPWPQNDNDSISDRIVASMLACHFNGRGRPEFNSPSESSMSAQASFLACMKKIEWRKGQREGKGGTEEVAVLRRQLSSDGCRVVQGSPRLAPPVPSEQLWAQHDACGSRLQMQREEQQKDDLWRDRTADLMRNSKSRVKHAL